jgi:hypothetical protein
MLVNILTDLRKKIAEGLWQFARRSPLVFTAGVFSGAALVIGLDGFVLKNGPKAIEQWGWMPVAERDQVAADLQKAQNLAEKLKRERDELAEKNLVLSAQVTQQSAQWQHCRQLESAIQADEQHLVQLGAKLKQDVIYAAPLNPIAFGAGAAGKERQSSDGEDSRSPEIDQDNFNIANLNASLSSLRAERAQSCNFASTAPRHTAAQTIGGGS